MIRCALSLASSRSPSSLSRSVNNGSRRSFCALGNPESISRNVRSFQPMASIQRSLLCSRPRRLRRNTCSCFKNPSILSCRPSEAEIAFCSSICRSTFTASVIRVMEQANSFSVLSIFPPFLLPVAKHMFGYAPGIRPISPGLDLLL